MAKLTRPVSSSDHIQGPENASMTLVEYGDYQCPYCGAAYPVVKRIQKKMGNQLRFVFRNFPLTESHEYAEQAAEAAEAAAAQGKFWEMHDMLYENQNALDLPSLKGYAQKLGLDTARFEQDLKNHTYLERIQADESGGIRSGVNGTPTFYINDLRYDGPVDYRMMMAEMQEA